MTTNHSTDLAVRATGLTKTFGDFRAVDGIDLEINRGEIFGVLGPNGAGKTTTIKMLATLHEIDAGRAEIFGVDVARAPHKIRQLIGVTGQYASVDEELTGRENLFLFARLQGVSRRAAKSTAADLLEEFGLEAAADKPLATFSGGMRRRLDLAASLITHPPLVFLDEPTTGLDPRTRNQMWETTRRLVDAGTTILLTTQYLDEADQLADRIAVIDHGRIVGAGTPAELKHSVGGSSLSLTLAESHTAPEAAARLSTLLGPDSVHSPAADRLVVSLREADDAAAILVNLREADISLATFSVDEPSLDDVFLSITGKPAEAAEDAAANAADQENLAAASAGVPA